MGEPKPLASLSSLLLARKGTARPAMRRPASLGYFNDTEATQDDLGWNDMGYDVDPDPSTPMDHDHHHFRNPLAGAVPEVNSEVRKQQEMIAKRLQIQAEVGFESLRDSPEVLNATVASPTAVAVAPVNADKDAAPLPVAAAPAIAPVPVDPHHVKQATKSVARAAPGSKDKAAFTLRLDKERHLKLRLACALSNRSAQIIVTEALDAFIEKIPEIGQIAGRVPPRSSD